MRRNDECMEPYGYRLRPDPRFRMSQYLNLRYPLPPIWQAICCFDPFAIAAIIFLVSILAMSMDVFIWLVRKVKQ